MGHEAEPWPPVDVDFGAADAVLTRIDETRRLLARQRADRRTQGTRIRASWTGPYAAGYDASVARSDRDAQRVLDELDALRRKIQDAIDEARARRRQDDRLRAALSPSPQPGPAPMPR